MTQLFRLQNVATKRRDRINSDEEERQRQGFELQSAVRFADARRPGGCSDGDGRVRRRKSPDAHVRPRGHDLAHQLGWRRRKDESELGFVLDIERGYWAKDTKASDDDDAPTR